MDSWLIVGLGNFGPEYENTRHNCGFAAIDALENMLSMTQNPQKRKFKGMYRECIHEGRKLILLRPYTYMNNSGESISEAMHWFGIKEDRLIVLYDDCDLDLGAIRVRPKGSAGTHNGMKSVLQYTDTDEFARIRIGIGKKPPQYDMIGFVLGHFSKEEGAVMEESYVRAGKAALSVIRDGCERAMSLYNGTAKVLNAEKQ